MRRRGIVSCVLALAVAGLVAIPAGCGTDEQEEEPTGADLTAVHCPMVPTGEEVGGVEQYEPAENAFDTAELVGMSLDDAQEKAAEHGCEIIVAFEDGEGIPVPLEIDPELIYVYTEDDVVTYIEGVGGGL